MIDPCWIWLGGRFASGYGRICLNSRTIRRIHRVVWEEANGSVPSGMDLHHLCGEKLCYKPSHLIAVGDYAHQWLHGRVFRSKTCRNGHNMEQHSVQRKRRNGFMKRVCFLCEQSRKREEYLSRSA
mgnify:CR=1 FL=1